MKRMTLKIHGRVHGVFFRASSREKAVQLGLKGWVKNAIDGTVELVAEGEELALKELRQYCQEGTEYGSVSRVDEKWEDVTKPHFSEFEIIY